MQITINYEKCIGCGECYVLCPKIFDFDDAGISQIKTELPVFTHQILTRLARAQKTCPTQAITVEKI